MSADSPRFRAVLDRFVGYTPGKTPASAAGPTFKMSSNESPYDPLPSVRAVIAGAADQINRYPDNTAAELIDAIASRLNVPAAHVAVGCGSVGIAQQLLEAVGEPGAEVLYAWRSFEAYPYLTDLANATSVQVPLQDAGHDLAAMAAAITDKTRLIFVCNPNNPTGTAVTTAELTAFFEQVPPDCLVVIDEAYVQYIRDPQVPDGLSLYSGRPNVAVLRTFSKAYGLAGLRVGYLVGHEPVAAAVRKTMLPFTVNSIAQAAAVASLAAESELLQRVDLVVKERERMRHELLGQGWTVPASEANFLWLPLADRSTDFTSYIDQAVGQVTAGAGATLAALQEAARAAGQDAGLDFASRDSCTIGGAVACDAGGARALRYGTARARVAGLEAVLANGSAVTRLTGLAKDNAGYDLSALLVGSEGTLGIITRVRWRLVPALRSRAAVLVPLASAREAAQLLASLRENAPSLESCDFFLDAGLQLVLEHQRRRSPLRRRAPLYVLAECAARTDPTEELAAALDGVGIDDAIVADDTPGRVALWRLREGHADAINSHGIPHKLDVGVPLNRLDGFLEEISEVAVAAGAGRVIVFGHLGDGNVHINVLGVAPDDPRVDDAVLELTLRYGGTISAEHGVGVTKARWLERAVGRDEVQAMRAIKRALDPDNLLNPGAVLPSMSGIGRREVTA